VKRGNRVTTEKAFTLQNAVLIDPKENFEGIGSLTIEDGVITSVNGKSKGNEIDCQGFYLAPGIIDIGVKICEPGEQHKESFKSAGASAAAGGITTMVTRPDTNPPIDNPEILEFFLRRAEQATDVRVIPMAALSKNLDGKELTEMVFLCNKGAIALTDGFKQVSDPKIFLNAMKYASDLDALIVAHPQDHALSLGTAATSGKFATLQGIPSVSTIAEKLGIDRDIILAEESGVRYHADQITTENALISIRAAKKRGIKLTAGTSIHHLILNEFDIANYRTFFKLSPPLRSEVDREAIVQGLVDQTLDTISSFHSPQDEESKRLPFQVAASGAVGLQTLLPACLKLVHNGYIDLPQLFQFISFNPAKILGISGGSLAKNCAANIIIFDKNAPFVMDRFKLFSKSKNTPFDEMTMQGKVLNTIVDGKTIYRDKQRGIKI